MTVTLIVVASLAACTAPSAGSRAFQSVEPPTVPWTSEVEVYEARGSSTRKCIRVQTPVGAKRACRTILATSGVHKVRFCVMARGQRYCVIRLIDLGDGTPSAPPELIDDTYTPPPEPPQPPPLPPRPTDPLVIPAPEYTPPDLSDPMLQGSADDFTLSSVLGVAGGARINPCEELIWSVDGTEEQRQMVREMLAIWSQRAGLQPREVTAPDHRPLVDAIPPSTLPRELGLPMMMIAWMDPSDVPQLRDGAIGVAKRRVNLVGVVMVEIALSTKAHEKFSQSRLKDLLEALVLHELGHAAGLSHVGSDSQVMYPSIGEDSPSRFQRGDLAGLHELARPRDCLHQ